MASNSEKCNKEMGNLIIQKRKEKHACMQSRARVIIFLDYFIFFRGPRARYSQRLFLNARGFKTQRAASLE